MASQCKSCGQGLSLTQRARGRDYCDGCSEKRASALAQATRDLEPALTAVVQSSGDAAAVARLAEVETTIRESGGDPATRKGQYYRSVLDHALIDERLTAEEEQHLDRIGQALYSDDEAGWTTILRDYHTAIFVAMLNDGRLPEATDVSIVLKKNERAHLACEARILKEVIHREYQSGSRGYSFRIAKGVSYRVGASRGKMVEVGRSLQVQDEGTLTITSQRAVYTGLRKSIEVPYSKLMDMNVFTDAIQFHVSGRQTPAMIGVPSGEMVAAIVNAAVQRM